MSAHHLLNDLGRRISLNSGEASFLYQRISILVQRFNAVLLHDSLPAVDSTDWRSYLLLIYLSLNFWTPSELYLTREKKIIIILVSAILPHLPTSALETVGPMNSTGITFLSELGRRLTSVTGDTCETMYLFQRVSLAVQRYNSVAFKDTCLVPTELD